MPSLRLGIHAFRGAGFSGRAARRAVAPVFAAALASVALSASCAGHQESGQVELRPSTETRWSDVVAEHTRRDETYDWLMRTADLRAMLVTPRLRKAFLDARPRFQGRFADDVEQELVAFGDPDPGVDVQSRPAPESEEQVLIFVALYVADRPNRDIAASYTIWETELTRGGARAKPIEIETLRSSPAVMDLFPFVTRFDDLYLVRFPSNDVYGRPFLSPGGEPLRLSVKSALADASVEWTLRE